MEKEKDGVISESEDVSAIGLSRRKLDFDFMGGVLKKNSEENKGSPNVSISSVNEFRDRDQ